MIFAFENSGSNLLFAIIAIVVTIALAVLVFLLIKHNVKLFREENDTLTSQTLTKAAMNKAVESYIRKVGNFGNFAMIYLDLDNFTNTNDIFGTEQCDSFLVELSDRIVKKLPFKAQVSKYNNDEFLVLIKEAFSYDQVCKIADALVREIRQKIYVSSQESIVITASAGIALYPSCGKTRSDLVTNLELATYISKREGGNKYTVYYSALSTEETSNYQFFKEVKSAIANKEFCLYYQPIMDMQHNEIYGFEALMRWNHPVQGVLPPGKFINVLDQSGDIYWVGQWGLETMINKLKTLSKLFQNGIARGSLNLSAKQLTFEKLADDLVKIGRKSGVDLSNITFEISDFAMFDRMENVKSNLIKLRDAGFKIAVDGFELDYAAIARIEKEPIDMIKIDRDFLVDINNNDIKEKFVTMLVESSRVANRLIVAEGIENKDMAAYVVKNKISYGQGYYYSKPMPEQEVDDFIRFRKWDEHKDETYNRVENVEPTPAPVTKPVVEEVEVKPEENATLEAEANTSNEVETNEAETVEENVADDNNSDSSTGNES